MGYNGANVAGLVTLSTPLGMESLPSALGISQSCADGLARASWPQLRHCAMSNAIAKLSPPRLARTTVERERLYRWLDDAAAAGSIWLCAAAGCGKTVLAASWARARKRPLFWFAADSGDCVAGNFLHYLQQMPLCVPARSGPLPQFVPDGRLPIDAVARAFVRTFHARLPGGAVLVIDDAERITAGSDGHAVLASLVHEAPAHVTLLISSRLPPAASLARAQVGGSLSVLAWDDLRLTAGETRALAAAHASALGDEQARRIHQACDGWPAGARLLAESARGRAVTDPGAATSDALFGYIASEIFEHLSPEARRVLLAVAPLASVSAEVAQAASDCPQAGLVLQQLARSDFFVSRLPGATPHFRLHPLLRRFLLEVAPHGLPSQERLAMQRRAASALAEAGDAIGSAALWKALHDWDALASLLEHSGNNLLGQGRHGEVLAWLDAMPPARLQGDALLGLWRARAMLATAPAEGVELLALLWPELERHAPLSRLVDAWEAVVCSHLFLRRPQRMADWESAADRLLARLDPVQDAGLHRRMLAASFVGFSKIAPQRWQQGEEAALALACDPSAPADLRLLFGASLHFHSQWRRGARALPPRCIAGLRALCREGQGSVHQRLVWLWIDVMLLIWFDPDETMQEVGELVRLAASLQEAHGIDEFGFPHFVPMLVAAHQGRPELAAGHAAALRALQPAPPHALFEMVPRHLMLTTHHLYQGDIAAAGEHARQGMAAAEQVGSPPQRILAHCATARVAAARGNLAAALQLLRRAAALAREHNAGAFRCAPWLAAAIVSLQAGRPSALGYTRRALRAMAQHGTLRSPQGTLTCRQELEQLCALAWEAGIERPWIASLVRVRGLHPPAGCGADGWPWPLRIRTGDELVVERDGQPLVFGRKAPRRVLELLRVLAEAGPRLVPAAQAVDALWADEEGDAGHRAFLTALHRLRKLVGERAVVHQDGRVGLDSCQVHIERSAAAARAADARRSPLCRPRESVTDR